MGPIDETEPDTNPTALIRQALEVLKTEISRGEERERELALEREGVLGELQRNRRTLERLVQVLAEREVISEGELEGLSLSESDSLTDVILAIIDRIPGLASNELIEHLLAQRVSEAKNPRRSITSLLWYLRTNNRIKEIDGKLYLSDEEPKAARAKTHSATISFGKGP